MAPMTTPAGRLLAIFDEVRQVRHASFRQVWAATLGHELASPAEVANMGELARLLRQVEMAATGIAESGADYDREALLYSYGAWASAVFGWGLVLTPDYKYSGADLVNLESRNALASTHNLLRAAAREGALPEDRRGDLLDHVYGLISEMLGSVTTDQDLPEWTRIQLAARLIEVRECIAKVRFRGDQAVGEALSSATNDFRSVADPSRHSGGEKSELQHRLDSWSETLLTLSRNFFAALAGPAAVSYFLTTGDAEGAGLLLATASPAAIKRASETLMKMLPQAPSEDRPSEV